MANVVVVQVPGDSKENHVFVAGEYMLKNFPSVETEVDRATGILSVVGVDGRGKRCSFAMFKQWNYSVFHDSLSEAVARSSNDQCRVSYHRK